VRQLAVRQARVRFSAPTMEIPLLSSSSEENGVEVIYMLCLSQSIKIQ
jgi:hypothetical protein